MAQKVRRRHSLRTGLSEEQVEAWISKLADPTSSFVLQARRSGMTGMQVGMRLNVTAERALGIEKQMLYVIASAAGGNERSLGYFKEAG